MTDLLLRNVKWMLDLENTTVYDEKLKLLYIPAAKSRLKGHGISEIKENEEDFAEYSNLVAYRCGIALGFDMKNYDHLREAYFTGCVELRDRQNAKK